MTDQGDLPIVANFGRDARELGIGFRDVLKL
jgi:hypothetical protein